MIRNRCGLKERMNESSLSKETYRANVKANKSRTAVRSEKKKTAYLKRLMNVSKARMVS